MKLETLVRGIRRRRETLVPTEVPPGDACAGQESHVASPDARGGAQEPLDEEDQPAAEQELPIPRSDGDGPADASVLPQTDGDVEAPTVDAEQDEGSAAVPVEAADRWQPLTRAVAGLGLAGAAAAGASYLYLLGFYSQWGLTPEQAGFSQADMVLRVAAMTLLIAGLLGVVLVPLLGLWLARRGARVVTRRQQWWLMGVAAVIVSALLVLSYTVGRDWEQPLGVLNSVLVLTAFALFVQALWLLLRGPGGEPVLASPGWRAVAGWVLISLVASVCVIGVIALPGAGARDGARLQQSPLTEIRNDLRSGGTFWYALFGPRITLGSVQWVADSPGPFGSTRPRHALLLAQRDGVTVFFDLHDCLVRRVPIAAVVFEDAAELHPDGRPLAAGPQTVPSECVRDP
jgi:hypothetical protein